jgi:hypothetical protein
MSINSLNLFKRAVRQVTPWLGVSFAGRQFPILFSNSGAGNTAFPQARSDPGAGCSDRPYAGPGHPVEVTIPAGKLVFASNGSAIMDESEGDQPPESQSERPADWSKPDFWQRGAAHLPGSFSQQLRHPLRRDHADPKAITA